MNRFEKLRVYHDAMDLVEIIYSLIKHLPSEERFSLADQLRRAVTSVVLNIAEGSGGLGDVEFKSFLRISLKSLYETIACLKIAERLYKLNIQEPLEKCNLVGKELHALIKSLNSPKKSDD